MFKAELYFLAGVLVYVAVIFFGSSRNSAKAKKWYVFYVLEPLCLYKSFYRFAAHLPVLERQFSKPRSGIDLRKDGYTDFYNFSTGRRNVASLHTIFTLRPRHDLLQWAFQVGRTFVDLQYRPRDDIQLDFRLAPGVLPHDFVWAVVAKDELLSIKDNRWDLVRFISMPAYASKCHRP